MKRPIRIALTKGRLERDSIFMMERGGIGCGQLKKKGRRLILPLENVAAQAVLAKAPDVITYVESGACDLGIVGKDTLLEHSANVYEWMELGFGRCRFALAAPKGTDFFDGYQTKTAATKYPAVAQRYFESLGMDVSIVKIEGSVELAPLLGLADGIVDIVQTGETLRENGLEVSRWICDVCAVLIVNVASLKLRKEEIEALTARFRAGLAAQ